jgi:hypothetical protein
MQNAEVFKETKVKKVVSTCAHCFNTLKNEYKEFGVELEVVHHTQLLNRLVREGKLTPLAPDAETEKKKITYHDPCFIGRHNKVYEPPRELLSVIPGAEFTEMPRNSEKSFCCGAGGAQMWMEETIGTRINTNRTKEAVATGADQIAVACPFCRVMLSDGLTAEQSEGNAREEVEVLDVAQMLLAGVKRAPAKVATKADSDAVVAEAEAVTAAAVVGDGSGDDGEESVPDVPAGDKEEAAWGNVGAVNADDTPAKEVPAEPVEEDAREEEAEASDTEIVAVEDAPSTSDPASEDAAPLSDANPSGAELSEAATRAADVEKHFQETDEDAVEEWLDEGGTPRDEDDET